jgi:GNAT superfamily N-acetyltransferase
MGAYTRQPYRGHSQDAPRVIAFLSEINRHPRFVADYYTGDFVWRSFRAPEASSRESIALWENASGQIAGIGFYDAPAELSYTIHPRLAGTPDEVGGVMDLIAWAEALSGNGRQETGKPLGVTVRTDQEAIQRELSERGYRPAGDPLYAGNFRRLDDPIAAPDLPAGFEIVAMTDEADLLDRVEIHRDVWAPSKFTRDAYSMLRDAPLYWPDLDLAVRAADGRYASYLIGWWDPVAKSGLLEPVGARSSYRRLGLTRALIQETLRRFHELGADRAFVNSLANDIPANALYRSAGFTRVAEWQEWTRP